MQNTMYSCYNWQWNKINIFLHHFLNVSIYCWIVFCLFLCGGSCVCVCKLTSTSAGNILTHKVFQRNCYGPAPFLPKLKHCLLFLVVYTFCGKLSRKSWVREAGSVLCSEHDGSTAHLYLWFSNEHPSVFCVQLLFPELKRHHNTQNIFHLWAHYSCCFCKSVFPLAVQTNDSHSQWDFGTFAAIWCTLEKRWGPLSPCSSGSCSSSINLIV